MAEAGGPQSSTGSNCVFCRICSQGKQELLYEDSEFVCFADRKPVSTHHFLVVPRKHITGAGQLTSSDQSMVERMAQIGKQVLSDSGGDIEHSVFGFHWPPLVTVKHLHMHVISPVNQMKWIHRAFIFKKNSYFFSSPEYMVDYLKSKQ